MGVQTGGPEQGRGPEPGAGGGGHRVPSLLLPHHFLVPGRPTASGLTWSQARGLALRCPRFLRTLRPTCPCPPLPPRVSAVVGAPWSFQPESPREPVSPGDPRPPPVPLAPAQLPFPSPGPHPGVLPCPVPPHPHGRPHRAQTWGSHRVVTPAHVHSHPALRLSSWAPRGSTHLPGPVSFFTLCFTSLPPTPLLPACGLLLSSYLSAPSLGFRHQ